MVENLLELGSSSLALYGCEVCLTPKVDSVKYERYLLSSLSHLVPYRACERFDSLLRISIAKCGSCADRRHRVIAHDRVFREAFDEIVAPAHGVSGIAHQSQRNR